MLYKSHNKNQWNCILFISSITSVHHYFFEHKCQLKLASYATFQFLTNIYNVSQKMCRLIFCTVSVKHKQNACSDSDRIKVMYHYNRRYHMIKSSINKSYSRLYSLLYDLFLTSNGRTE